MALDPKDFIFSHRKNEELTKPSGSLLGKDFVLEQLQDCVVYVLDHTSQVQVDDCVNCKIVIGPCSGSIFIRDCSDCEIVTASRQLRTRDCKDLLLSVYCATQPSIETSIRLTFFPWAATYPELTSHFEAAGLDPSKNNWHKVYDFNGKDDLGDVHFTVESERRFPWVVNLNTSEPGFEGTQEVLYQAEEAVVQQDNPSGVWPTQQAHQFEIELSSEPEGELPLEAPTSDGSPDACKKWAAANQQRLKEVHDKETAAKQELKASAKHILETFVEARKKKLASTQHPGHGAVGGEANPSGSGWELVAALISSGKNDQRSRMTTLIKSLAAKQTSPQS